VSFPCNLLIRRLKRPPRPGRRRASGPPSGPPAATA